ncbi:hypothetical protein [Sphingomonas carotinifaciens]|uniref:Uncharacterized protein n=1 Tax=Sphingomonas carotinifaciens TaxID=1166323 RepID=A0A1G7GJI5_9SPHN|nr:hypothetical protein [Sphingomonas carotinifaciens]MBB4086551.1 hypothetical protein [Sphingomonas carotinifaciens]MWC42902.1 hypothetical protein [Sphingomonas carotinifaciens]SDE88223.1 hypothetical protein SAMN05216557_101910 [Sphingomonas carotinifaciens]
MGKKKNRKRKAAEAARQTETGGGTPLTALQGLGSALLDQLRSPLGRQVIAAALIAAAGAISRAGPTASSGSESSTGDDEKRDMPEPPAPPPFPPEMTKIAGVALNAFDNWLAHKTRS